MKFKSGQHFCLETNTQTKETFPSASAALRLLLISKLNKNKMLREDGEHTKHYSCLHDMYIHMLTACHCEHVSMLMLAFSSKHSCAYLQAHRDAGKAADSC